MRYTYKNGNGNLKQMTYANGSTVKLSYNSLGQPMSERWYPSEADAAADTNITAHYKYSYDRVGNIVRSVDILALKEYNYEYESGVIVRATESAITLSGEIVTSKSLINSVRYTYDSEGELVKKTVTPSDGTKQVTYYETDENGTVTKLDVGGRIVTSHSKTDSFGRKVFDELQLGKGFVSRQYVYHGGEITQEHKESSLVKSTPTSQLVSRVILSDGTELSYGYDAEERISHVVETRMVGGAPVTNTTLYTYDALGQLVSETVNGNPVTTVSYDSYGNITSKNGKAYTYGDSVWKDLLTSYDGQAITYDAQGNPISYLGNTLTWEKGRQLKSFGANSYTYNANGIRTGKVVNGVAHSYTLDGMNILREVWGENELTTLYDNEEAVCGITLNGAAYYFLKNLQGDVIAITDADGEVIARYTYDAWGKILSVTDNAGNAITDASNVALVNPYRYRSYYYDSETSLYYLNSRYYDPETGRFVNADEVMMITFSAYPFAYSLWSYCFNDPMNRHDSTGYISANDVSSYIKETFIAWLMNRYINLMKNGEIEKSFGNIWGFKLSIKLKIEAVNPKNKYGKYTRSYSQKEFEAVFKNMSFKLGWGKKRTFSSGISVGKYTLGFERGVDWKRNFIAMLISCRTKDKRFEFTMGIYLSVYHLLLLALAVTVAGACVAMPVVVPAFISVGSALVAKAGAIAGIGATVINRLSATAA